MPFKVEVKMKLTVTRIKSDRDSTLSTVSVNGKFECFGIEDEHRVEKVANETRIPAGIYKVGVRDVGGFHNRYSAKFPEFHLGMLQVLDVPDFEYILIHIGNDDDDTAGCLLVGMNAITQHRIANGASTAAYIDLYKKVIESALAGTLYIKYIDLDL